MHSITRTVPSGTALGSKKSKIAKKGGSSKTTVKIKMAQLSSEEEAEAEADNYSNL